MNDVLLWLERNRARHVAELTEFLAIPGVSTSPAHADDVRKAAAWTARALRRCGLHRVELFQTLGHPIVYGEWRGATGRPTVLCYGHYDVQPAEPLEQWETPPFEPTIRGGQIYARGATDDKGQLFVHLKAIESWLGQGERLPVNVKVLIEGEEEVGSPNLPEFVRRKSEMLACDVVVISDGAMFSSTQPSLTCSVRGIAYFEVAMRSARADLHSGSFGGAVGNAAGALIQVLATLKDSDGRVAIPGFYDDVEPPTEGDRATLGEIPFDESGFLNSVGVEPAGESGWSTLERLWWRPCLDVNGIASGFTGSGSKTVIPSAASAKVSMRLVPNQDPDRVARLFEQHVATMTPHGTQAAVTMLHGGRPWRIRRDTPYLKAAARAIEVGFGKTPVLVGEGGSNSVPVLEEALEAPVVMLDIGLPDDGAHAPNEHLHLERLHRGIVTIAQFYREVGSELGVAPRSDQSTSLPLR